MKRFFRNIPWRNILIIGLVAILGIGAVVGISAVAKEEKKEISSFAFKRGAIDLSGNYVESKTAIYTKDLIECQGLEIVPDFEATGDYQVFYYDANKLYLGATELFSAHSGGVYIKGEDFPYAKYCRIMITPETEKDDNGNTIEDYEIKFYEVAGIANKFTISVDKEQPNISAENLIVVDESKANKICSYDTTTKKFVELDHNGASYSMIDVKNINTLKLVFEEESLDFSYFFYDKNDNYISGGNFVVGELVIVLDIPTEATKVGIIYSLNNIPSAYRAS